MRLDEKAFLSPPTTDAAHTIFFSQTYDILRDESTK